MFALIKECVTPASLPSPATYSCVLSLCTPRVPKHLHLLDCAISPSPISYWMPKRVLGHFLVPFPQLLTFTWAFLTPLGSGQFNCHFLWEAFPGLCLGPRPSLVLHDSFQLASSWHLQAWWTEPLGVMKFCFSIVQSKDWHIASVQNSKK